ncbi:unnamed protein product [Spirodela intermedia]|uniref:Uncharacterized protein n=1 Tax=Spirodela intermedia TaxID=51605 RepID=A0A7I8J1I6_SPIIN|nr:unnamed protein product [Spirodela intermedia]CAA6664084.1 unnamed protein product [Spirodela intermedia]
MDRCHLKNFLSGGESEVN